MLNLHGFAKIVILFNYILRKYLYYYLHIELKNICFFEYRIINNVIILKRIFNYHDLYNIVASTRTI